MERGTIVALLVCFAMASTVGLAAADSGSGHMEPKNVRASCGTASATVSWSAVKDPTLVGYNVFEKVATDPTYTQANNELITTTSYLVTGLLSATTYDFGVTAVYSDGQSSAMAGPATCTTA